MFLETDTIVTKIKIIIDLRNQKIWYLVFTAFGAAISAIIIWHFNQFGNIVYCWGAVALY